MDAMEAEHDPWCDRSHSGRQRCNEALRPTDPLETFSPPTLPAEPDAQREAVAAAGAPEPTPYAAREWQTTVAALERPAYEASERAHAMETAKNRGGPLLSRAVLIAAAIAVAMLLWSLRRPRPAEAPAEE